MENQHTPVHDESVIVVASNKKHSWSKKERLALSIAAVFALVGIGLGGFTFYNQVIANAAGEESLGSDVVVDLPPANESPYFTVTNVLEQDVFITMKGDATRTTTISGAQPYSYEGDMANGWRLEQTATPLDESSWKVVAQEERSRLSVFYDGFSVYSNDPKNSANHVVLSSNLIDRGRRPQYMDTAGSNAFNTVTLDDTTNPEFLQPGKTYYFRASRASYSADKDGSTVTTWSPQGNSVQVTTKQYDLHFTVTNNNSTNIKVSWSGFEKQPSSLADWSNMLHLMRVGKISDVYSTDALPEDTKWDGEGNHRLWLESSGDFDWPNLVTFTAGTKEFTQEKDTSYYYALVAVRNNYITHVLGEPILVSTLNSTDKPFISATVSPSVIPADNIKSAVLTFKNSDTSTGEYSAGQSSSIVDKSGQRVGSGCYNWNFDITSATQPVSYTLDLPDYDEGCHNIKPGDYNIVTEFSRSRPSPITKQVLYTPITLSKIDPSFTANYTDSSVKKGKNVVINLTHTPSDMLLNSWAEGTFKIMNLNTNKVVKTFSWNTNSSLKKKITLKGVKKGTYNLALVYTADTKQGIYQDKTINLPKLTVK